MSILFLLLAVVIVLVGHVLRMKRWAGFVEIYEKADYSHLLKAMSLGYMVDFFLPFHIGDLFKAIYAGRKMRNKTMFALATIFIDRLLDLFAVASIYIVLIICNNAKTYILSAIFYIVCSVLLVLVLAYSIRFSKPFKVLVLRISSVFCEKIQLGILLLVWSGICTIKNILYKINKLKLIGQSIAMWMSYMLSYYLLSAALSDCSTRGMSAVFNTLFNQNQQNSFANLIKSYISGENSEYIQMITLFFLLTCIGLYLLAGLAANLLPVREEGVERNVIPYSTESARLDFLKIYFSDVRDTGFINEFLSMNRDVTVLKNFSAGSNATTLLCMNKEGMFFRKYAFGKDADKLHEQIEWIKHHASILSVTDIIREKKKSDSCCYDMPYNPMAPDLFTYIHSAPLEESWKIIQRVVDDLEANYQGQIMGKADSETIEKYIEKKVRANIEKISIAPAIRTFYKYKKIIINGMEYNNLSAYEKFFESVDFWKEIFKNDYYADIHGDLTIENIICSSEREKGYFLIDPNGDNVHSSPNLDYAKLLQSLHGGYEFLMHTKKVKYEGNSISFSMTRSAAYQSHHKRLKKYMLEKFGLERTRSIYFHEIIHWLRLMPYKLSKDSNRVPMFYAGMIMVINDVFEEFYNQ